MKKLLRFPTNFTGLSVRLLVVGIVFLLAASFRSDGVIKDGRAFLIGDYEFICTYDNGKKTESTAYPDRYTLRITKRDEMIVYRNEKKWTKYYFTDMRIPMIEEEDYVVFYQKDANGDIQNYPLFYKGDTVVMHAQPFQFKDNYFRKK